MFFVQHNLHEAFLNADGDKNLTRDILIDELAKLIANNQLNVVYVLRNANIPIPERISQADLCKIVLENMDNPRVAKEIATLMLINNQLENYLSANGKRFRNSDSTQNTSFGVNLSDMNPTTSSATDQKSKSELGKQVVTTLQDEKVQSLIAKGLATISTMWKSKQTSDSTALNDLKSKTSSYTPTKSGFKPVYALYIILGIGAVAGAGFLIWKKTR
jgi:hypothetical protein